MHCFHLDCVGYFLVYTVPMMLKTKWQTVLVIYSAWVMLKNIWHYMRGVKVDSRLRWSKNKSIHVYAHTHIYIRRYMHIHIRINGYGYGYAWLFMWICICLQVKCSCITVKLSNGCTTLIFSPFRFQVAFFLSLERILWIKIIPVSFQHQRAFLIPLLKILCIFLSSRKHHL